ncbi:MAG: NAD(P)H-dependent oxidoreductase [Thermoguttaceae bacterium]
MNILVILAHPRRGSFNHAIAETATKALCKAGHRVVFHDLCGEEFPSHLPAEEMSDDAPVPPLIEQHCKELSQADGIVVVHPNWWGQPPAILKGWVDRVVRPGVAYRFEETDSGDGIPIGLLRADAALVFNTSNTPFPREQAVFGDPLETIWKNCIFDLCGVKTFVRRMFSVVVTSSPQQRTQWLEEVEELATTCFPASRSCGYRE